MKKWKVLSSHYVYKSPYGNLRRDKCLLDNGVIIEEYNVNEFPNWVNGVVVNKDRELIFVKQYRHGCGDFFYEIPAGMPNDGETYLQAIEREVLEETGYKSDQVPIYLGESFVNPATQNNKVISYLITDAYLAAEQNLDAAEQIEVFKFRLEDIDRMIEKKEITQMFSVLAISLAKKYLT